MPELVKVPVVVQWWDDRDDIATGPEEITARISYQDEVIWIDGLGDEESLAIPLSAIAQAIAAGAQT